MYTNLWVCFYRKVYSIVIIVIGSPPLLTIQDSSRLTTNKVKNLRVSPDVGQHGAKSLATLGCTFAHPTAVGRRLLCMPRREKDHSGLFLLPPFSSISLKRKKIETGLLSCLYFLGSPRRQRSCQPVMTKSLCRPRHGGKASRTFEANYKANTQN